MPSPHHCICGALNFEPVILEPIGEPPYALPTMVCIGCDIVFVVAHSDRSDRHHRFLRDERHAEIAAGIDFRAKPPSYSSAPAPAGARKTTMATAKKTPAKKTAAKTDKTTRGRNQDRALVAAMEDYEVKYLATKHSVTQKAVTEAVAKVGNSRNKVEQELKVGKAK